MDARPHDSGEPPEEPLDRAPRSDPGPDEAAPGVGADAAGTGDDGDAPTDAADDEAETAVPADRAGTTEHAARPADASADEIDDVDRRWQEIVAQLGDLEDRPVRPEPIAPERAPEASTDEPPAPGHPTGTTPARVVRPAGTADPRAWEPDPVLEEAESHFEPPDPGPVMGGDPLLTMAWSAVIGVPVLMLLAVVLWRDMPTIVLQVAGVAFAVGLGLLLWRMPHGDEDDDRGPGAVV